VLHDEGHPVADIMAVGQAVVVEHQPSLTAVDDSDERTRRQARYGRMPAAVAR